MLYIATNCNIVFITVCIYRYIHNTALYYSAFVTLFPDVLSPVDPHTGRPVWFTESHLVLVIFVFIYVLFTQFILDIK